MNRSRVAPVIATVLAALTAVAVGGCSKKLTHFLVQNQAPTVRLTSAPYDTTSRYFYSYRLNWLGNDPDGKVDHFVYWVDGGKTLPRTITTNNEQIVQFPSTRPDSTGGTTEDRSSDFHTFSIEAIDNEGDSSEVESRSFFSYTVAPTVRILSPSPSHLGQTYTTPAILITWTGNDPDGQRSNKPVKYKFKLFEPGGSLPLDLAANGDSVRVHSAPYFFGWDSSSTDTTSRQYTNLSPSTDYVFVVVAFDEAGAYSPIFSQDSNILRIHTTFAGSNGPKLTAFNSFFFYNKFKGLCTRPECEVPLEVPTGQPITFNWFADPAQAGSDISAYRWKLGGDVFDETARTNEQTDFGHWSAWSLQTTSATIGPFLSDTLVRFYIEAKDVNDLVALGTIRLTAVKATFAKPLLFVNDTRFINDQTSPTGPGGYKPPTGPWPTRAELDTFLFAVGGVPWRAYPAGTNSPPGLFKGYAFDTATTLTGSIDFTFPLHTLGQYRSVVWMTDVVGANVVPTNTSRSQPFVTSLRFMASPNHVNTIATYNLQGGNLWLLGGGGALATLADYQKRTKVGQSNYTNTDGEVIPGRMMYDLAHWQNSITVGGFATHFDKSSRAVGGWTNEGPQLNLNAPDYGILPVALRAKDPSRDPFPPNRTGQSSSSFYQTSTSGVEFLDPSVPNFIVEDIDPSVLGVNQQPVLDTLYTGSTNTQVLGPVMTYYHGVQNAPFVFSGFPLWWLTRDDGRGLSRFVLSNIFGLNDPGQLPAHVQPVAGSGRVMPVSSPPAAARGSAGALERVLRQRAPAPVPPSSIRKPQE